MKGQRREIVLLGDPILRKCADEIEDWNDAAVRSLADELIFTMLDTNAIGLAAPQIGVAQRLFVMRSRPSARYPDAPQIEPFALINPVLIKGSSERTSEWESCKSIPGLCGRVERHHRIQVRYTSLEGDEISQEIAHPVVARIFQHEYDHLNGITFLERVSSTNDLAAEPYVRVLESSAQRH